MSQKGPHNHGPYVRLRVEYVLIITNEMGKLLY